MSEKYVIDRIEGKTAVCQDLANPEKMKDIPLETLPCGVKEGSYLFNENGIYSIDTESETLARTRIRSKMNRLFNR